MQIIIICVIKKAKMKRLIKAAPYLILLNTFHALAVNSAAEQWVNSVNGGFTSDFKSSEPTIVPNYEDGVTYSDDPDTIKSEALKESQTNEGAQLIYSLGRKPDISDQEWFKDASDITENPSSVIDMGDGGYTDCEEVTTPGDSYSTTESCTQTVVPESRTCSYGPEIEVDSHYLYECMKERDTTDQTCNVGRVIDVTQSHNYGCKVGEDFYDKVCQKKLVVTVKNNTTTQCNALFYVMTEGGSYSNKKCRLTLIDNSTQIFSEVKSSECFYHLESQVARIQGMGYTIKKYVESGDASWILELCKSVAAEPTITETWTTTCSSN